MKLPITPLISLLCFSASSAIAQSASEKKLQTLTQRYEAVAQGKAVTDAQKALTNLRQHYELALTQMAKRKGDAGQAHEAAALEAERSLAAQGNPLPPLDSSAPADLQKMRKIYTTEHTKITTQLERSLAPAQRTYRRDLEQLDAELTKKGLINEASAVRTALSSLGADQAAGQKQTRISAKEQVEVALFLAEWVLANDGYLETTVGNIGLKEKLTTVPAESFTIKRAYLRSKEGPIPWDKLKFLPEVDHFAFHQSTPPVTAEQMVHLRDLPNLRKLSLRGNFEPNALEQMPPLPNVKSLWKEMSGLLSWDQIRAKLPNVEVLNIMNEVLTDAAAAEIAQWKTMRDMETSGPLNEAIGQLFGAMPNLHRFSLHTGSQLEPTALRHFSGLREFHTRNTDPTMLTTLAALPNIEKLHVGGQVPTEEMQALFGKLKLKDFGFVPSGDFAGTAGQLKITQHVPVLLSCPALEYLELRGTDLTDEALMQLTELKGLKRINVSRSLVTDEGAEAFRKRRPTCDLIRRD